MENDIFQQRVSEWKKRNNIKRNDVTRYLLDIYRRVHYFHNGDYNTNLCALFLPSEAKIVKEYLIPKTGLVVNLALNWYRPNKKGIAVLKDLDLDWSDKENLNHILFTY